MYLKAYANSLASKQSTRATPLYGRWLLGAYALFFAVIAPFICWGSASDANHNHAGAHFVFSEELSVATPHSSKTHGHDYCRHDPMLRHNRMTPDKTASPQPEGDVRSAPVVTLISLIMLLVFGTKETLFQALRQIIHKHPFTPAKNALLLVPTPPPRVSLAFHTF